MIQEEFTELMEQMNQVVAESIEQNMEAQAALVESWADALDETIPEEAVLEEGLQGYMRAYDIWMDANEEMFEEATKVLDGGDLEPREFRDIWLSTANEAFSEVMSTTTFAAQNGELVESVLSMRQNVNEVTEDSLAQVGMPTQGDVEEVGRRLVELERRQHKLETKLDRVLDAIVDEE